MVLVVVTIRRAGVTDVSVAVPVGVLLSRVGRTRTVVRGAGIVLEARISKPIAVRVGAGIDTVGDAVSIGIGRGLAQQDGSPWECADGEVAPPVGVEVSRRDPLRIHRRQLLRGGECAVAPAQQNRDGAGASRHGEVVPSIAVEVSGRDELGVHPRREACVRAEGAVTPPEENGDIE